MPHPNWLNILNQEVISCTLCARLVVYREQIAREKRRAYLDWEYWGKPVPGFGDPNARVLVLGLAPGAHGSNRTGRPFTGDASETSCIQSSTRPDSRVSHMLHQEKMGSS
jgi:uracil-DNA glycosylase